MRSNYWSCSKFANWLRGTVKPYSGTGDEWKKWEIDAKANHPIRHWMAEEGLDFLQNAVMWVPDKLYSFKYYAINRWIDQSNALVAHPKHIKPGQYMDLSYRVLYCLFDELVDFVEIESAYLNYRWDDEKQKGMKWWQVGRWRTRTWRSAEAGIEHLNWQMSLTDEEWLDEDKKHEAKPTSQAISAREIYDLYKWWTDIRPNRPDPHDVSGWSAHCDDQRKRGVGFMETDPLEDQDKIRAMLDQIRSIEADHEKEDTDMLIRLIKIRGHLWT